MRTLRSEEVGPGEAVLGRHLQQACLPEPNPESKVRLRVGW